MNHVALIGDSILDNAAYVSGGPAVIDQVRENLPDHWRASLLAVDGSLTADVAGQLDRLPADTTHIVVSAGGNDALMQIGILSERVDSIGYALDRFASTADVFELDYKKMLKSVLARKKSTVVCTIYYPNIPEPVIQRRAVTALTVFNDCIIRAAIQDGLPLVDLRLICCDPADYANEIEPSVIGGSKIASAIARAVTETDFSRKQTSVFI